MMRPASALHYLSELEAVALEAAQQVEARRAGREALEVNTVCSQFALDAVGVFALGTRLGALQGTGDGKVNRSPSLLHLYSIRQRLIELNEEMFTLINLLLPFPAWLLDLLPQMKRLEKVAVLCFSASFGSHLLNVGDSLMVYWSEA